MFFTLLIVCVSFVLARAVFASPSHMHVRVALAHLAYPWTGRPTREHSNISQADMTDTKHGHT